MGQRSREWATEQARLRAMGSSRGIGAAFSEIVRNPSGDEDTGWKGAVVVADGDQVVELLVRSRTHSWHEMANPDLLADIVTRAAADRGDVGLEQLGQPTGGLFLEDHAPELVDDVFRVRD